MKLLVIGGSRFVGRHLIEAALEQGYDVTMFNRGQTNPGAYADVEEIHGDRDGGLDGLRGREWDVVVDTSGYVPRIVRQSAELLKDSVGHYVFVSSISVYQKPEEGLLDEADSPLHTLEDESVEEITGETYGGLKVLCENVVDEIYGERGTNVRAGFIVGNYDVAWRLPHLIHRYDSAGEKLAGRPEQAVQIIHARPLGEWMLHAAANNVSGAYNLTGEAIRMDTLLNAISAATGTGATPLYVGDPFLQDNEVAPIDGLHYWVPESFEKLMTAPVDKALAAGLQFMPLDEIIADVLGWSRSQNFETPPERVQQIAMLPEREADLLKRYHEAQPAE